MIYKHDIHTSTWLICANLEQKEHMTSFLGNFYALYVALCFFIPTFFDIITVFILFYLNFRGIEELDETQALSIDELPASSEYFL